MNLFKQIKTKLYDGTVVKEGDKVAFVNSDGESCEGLIERRQFDATHMDTGEKLKKGTLFFWNIGFNVSDYRNAFLV
ncbi:hypothetical protein [Plebeiibacterium marinum]|uniref:Uncharacterized protein n=1 Tax=Plebeiibacterium marinum TaxID=2992111 RepID=A0AAE3MIR5_9BACT|nr:hypothetical protein [Plebeiobacterium marinum]MCW3808080.1 hypothetical protein [Plebeiobacterium marinum]